MHSSWIGESWAAAALAFSLATIGLVVLRSIDSRRLDGENVWAKPFRFTGSLAVHFATFTVIMLFCSESVTNRASLQAVAVASLAAGVIVFGYIAMQAARQRRSHYNTTTSTEKLLYNAMGIGALVVLAPAFVLGASIATAVLPGWSLTTRIGSASGLVIGAVLTLVTGMRMDGSMSHSVGIGPASPRTMVMTGWSLDVADVRRAHFLANHMMQVVPLMAAMFSWLLAPRLALLVTFLIAGGWTWMTWSSFKAALAGTPLPKFWRVLAARRPRASSRAEFGNAA